jgi:hypothetical protein
MKTNKSNLFASSVATGEIETAADRQKLQERLGEVQRNARCVGRAVRVMAFLTAFAVAGLGYSTVLIPDWPQTLRQFFMYWPVKAHCALACASLSCAFAFVGLGLLYRRELSSLAQELTQSGDARIVPLPIGTGSENGSLKDAA